MRLLFSIFFFIIVSPVKSQCGVVDSLAPDPSIIYCKTGKSKLEDTVNNSYVQLDIQRITEQFNKSIACDGSLTNLLSVFPTLFSKKYCNCLSKTIQLGDGIKLTTYQFYGGYCSFALKIVYFDSVILKMHVSMSTYPGLMENYYLKHIKVPLVCLEDEIGYEKEFPSSIEKYRKDSGRLFIVSQDITDRKYEVVSFFANPFMKSQSLQELHVYDDFIPKAFTNVNYLILSKDYSSLENLLYCTNPIGRLFAARALSYLVAKENYMMSEQTVKRVEWIYKKGTVIKSGILSCWIGKYDYTYYDIWKDFELFIGSEYSITGIDNNLLKVQ
jgi:hypothetical protein